LATPFAEVKEQVDQLRLAEVIAASEASAARLQAAMDGNATDGTAGAGAASANGEGGAVKEAKLWVDTFGPKGYRELVSSEGVNSKLLTWFKRWDPVVFNRQASLSFSLSPPPSSSC